MQRKSYKAKAIWPEATFVQTVLEHRISVPEEWTECEDTPSQNLLHAANIGISQNDTTNNSINHFF